MPEDITMVGAIAAALADAMEDDPNVVVLGEDVGRNGGVFRATDGLFERFGPDRVIDTPISEASFVGWAVGMAAMGMRPVVEYQFCGFSYPAIEQLVSHATRLRWRSRGRMSSPVVIRIPFGAGVHAPENHSESPEAMFSHIPGLTVTVPCTPQTAYDAIRIAVREPDPTVIFEPKRLYRQSRGPLERRFPEQAEVIHRPLPLKPAAATLLTWGACVKECTDAAIQLEQKGIAVDLLALIRLRPLPEREIADSVRRTGRLVIVHEAPKTGGFGAEVAARMAEIAITRMRAPILRICQPDVPTPYPALEWKSLPTAERIVREVEEYVRTWR